MLLFSPFCWKMCNFILQQNKPRFPLYNLWSRLHALFCFGKLWFVLNLGHWKMGWDADLLVPLNHILLDEMCLSGTLCWRTLIRARKQWKELGTKISQGRCQERGDGWVGILTLKTAHSSRHFVSSRPWHRGMREEALWDINNEYGPGKLPGDN